MARPKEFDPDDALEKAMQQFWAKGYFDTSIRDLIDRTGVNYYGLYGEFGNKHGLFLAALDLYRDTVTAEALKELDGLGPVRQAILRMFNRLSELTRTPDGRVGCLMCNTAVEVAPTDEEAARRVKAHRQLIEKAVAAALIRAKENGEIGASADIRALSEFLATTAYTAGMLTRSGCSEAMVRRHIETALSTVR